MNENDRLIAAKQVQRMQNEALKEGVPLGKDGIPLVLCICPDCKRSLPTPYIELYAQKRCPSCSRLVKPFTPDGTKMYCLPWGMSYGSFCLCLRHEAYWNEVGPLLRSWYSYTFSVFNGIPLITDLDGTWVDSFDLHLKIQGNEDQRYRVYQAYMKIAR